jgi:hypothetical protein
LDTGGVPDIVGIRSGEGEEVELGRIKLRNNGVEVWMKSIESDMQKMILKKIKDSYSNFLYGNIERKEWVLNHIG